nr:retrotransposon Orf1 [Tanacetum cinerariifolium]
MAEKTCIGRIIIPSGCDFYLCNHGCDVKYGPDAAGVCFIITICLCYYKCPPSPPMNLDVANHDHTPLAIFTTNNAAMQHRPWHQDDIIALGWHLEEIHLTLAHFGKNIRDYIFTPNLMKKTLTTTGGEGSPLNLKIPCNIRHVHVGKAYIDLNSPIDIMNRMQSNWITRKQLEPREDSKGLRGISNFTGRVRGMHIFVGNFTYVSDFVIVEDISSTVDPRLSQVVLGKPFVKISNMTYDLLLLVVKFTNGAEEISYKMPHKIKQFNSLSDLEKEHT